MVLPRQEVVSGLVDEYAAFRDLLLSLDEGEWNKATRCEGWEVADVAAHLTGTLTEIVNGRLDGLGDPEKIQATVDERKGRTAAEVADELEQGRIAGQGLLSTFDDEAWAGPSPAPGIASLGEGVEALWYDAYVHAEDVRSAIGRASEQGPGLRASVSHLADLLTAAGWGPATLALDGLEEFDVSGGGGQRVTGDPLQFVLVATGRADPASLGLDETVNIYR